jgi:Ser/Thr protein kinase RdoA (MazF antagonist)
MTIEYLIPPKFPPKRVEEFAASQYGLEGRVQPLPGERDQNLLLDSEEDGLYVIKISNEAESLDFIEFQNDILQSLAGELTLGRVPSPIPSLSGSGLLCPKF